MKHSLQMCLAVTFGKFINYIQIMKLGTNVTLPVIWIVPLHKHTTPKVPPRQIHHSPIPKYPSSENPLCKVNKRNTTVPLHIVTVHTNTPKHPFLHFLERCISNTKRGEQCEHAFAPLTIPQCILECKFLHVFGIRHDSQGYVLLPSPTPSPMFIVPFHFLTKKL